MSKKLITLYEIRQTASFGSDSMGNRKLRSRVRAQKIARRLRQMGLQVELHKWRINPAGLRLDYGDSKGTVIHAIAVRTSPHTTGG